MNLLASMRYLVALSEQRHFSRAALVCNITQPALSNAIKALEVDFGVVIIKRGRTYEGLTPEGERVLATAQRMLHEHKLLLQELGSQADNPVGTVRIGAVPTAVPIAARFAAMLQARHAGIQPVVLSHSSTELEIGVESLAIDLALGYTERMALRSNLRDAKLTAWPQYTEHYFLLRRAARAHATELQIGPSMQWKEAAQLPLCLLTPDMHNRTIVDAAFITAGAPVRPAIETNSILTMALAVVAGNVCSVMPGALVGAVRGYRELEALPLVGPVVRTAIGFMSHSAARPSRAMEAALTLLQDGAWLRHAAAHSGLLVV
jgi:DNA-binding transcriptional LysR family regulator